jgi:hypothetical protein
VRVDDVDADDVRAPVVCLGGVEGPLGRLSLRGLHACDRIGLPSNVRRFVAVGAVAASSHAAVVVSTSVMK